ncbi:MAG: bifunctional folylpolyglutamate synthase/dihydrofolate synthase [Thermoflexibacteraceae bacterium]|jgi:dihydrofolate synthase/folylpolyglutamate synthase
MMTFDETLHYLYNKLPMFQRIGAAAYKADLDNTIALCKHLGNPEKKLKTIHIAGTNGKGSSSHLIAAVLQQAGYRTGLYTSPHLKSFTERIRINGQEIEENYVTGFVAQHFDFIEQLQPSFFELTVGLAFSYFLEKQVDIAVIEVGLGGRLDSTNVILPEVSLITNISYDHQNLLGDTLSQIATEKAGIIKPHTPVVISQWQDEIATVFEQKSQAANSPLVFADSHYQIIQNEATQQFQVLKNKELLLNNLSCELKGSYQPKNFRGVIGVIECLRQKGYAIPDEAIREGFAKVCSLTGLKGRWQQLGQNPLIICDTGHNEDGIRQIVAQIQQQKFKQLHFVLGAVNDKAIDKILVQLPKNAIYYFCKPNLPRGLDANNLQMQAQLYELVGNVYDSVQIAIDAAKAAAKAEDMIFIGGSTFVVAEIADL